MGWLIELVSFAHPVEFINMFPNNVILYIGKFAGNRHCLCQEHQRAFEHLRKDGIQFGHVIH